MKQSIKMLLTVLAFVIVLAAATVGYNILKNSYDPEEQASSQENENTTENGTASGSEAAEVVKKAADFTVKNSDGEEVTLSAMEGKPVIINFWATWCGPCRSELPDFDSISAEYADDIVFMMINLTDGFRDTEEGVKNFVEENGYSFPVYFDTAYNAADAYAVYSIPMTVLINSDGTLFDSHTGMLSEAKLKDYVDKLLKNNR